MIEHRRKEAGIMSFGSLLTASGGHTERTSKRLVRLLAVLAGATAALGFFTAEQYAAVVKAMPYSYGAVHMGSLRLMFLVLMLLVCFALSMAISSAFLRWRNRKQAEGSSAGILIFESILLASCGSLAAHSVGHQFLLLGLVAVLFSFTIELQYAMIILLISKVLGINEQGSILTRLGIEVGDAIYQKTSRTVYDGSIDDTRNTLILLSGVVGLFVFGTFVGTLLFRLFGIASFLVLATVVFIAAAASFGVRRLSK
jgi:hypothetical protein